MNSSPAVSVATAAGLASSSRRPARRRAHTAGWWPPRPAMAGLDLRVRQRAVGERPARRRPRHPHRPGGDHRVARRHLGYRRARRLAARRPLAGGSGAGLRAEHGQPPADRPHGLRHRSAWLFIVDPGIWRRWRLDPRLRRAPRRSACWCTCYIPIRANIAARATALLRAPDHLGAVPLPRLRRAVPRPVRPVRQSVRLPRLQVGQGRERARAPSSSARAGWSSAMGAAILAVRRLGAFAFLGLLVVSQRLLRHELRGRRHRPLLHAERAGRRAC